MTWDAFHHRGEVLRSVIAEADRRRDGVLPTGLSGVAETFADEADLIGALQLRWHTRLAGTIERELVEEPSDPEQAVVAGWSDAAAHAPGLRAVLDAQAAAPVSEAVHELLARAVGKERAMLAAMAGLAAPGDPHAARLGRALEELGRARAHAGPGGAHRAEAAAESRPAGAQRSLISRLKAHLAA